jgi:hypothetical protein
MQKIGIVEARPNVTFRVRNPLECGLTSFFFSWPIFIFFCGNLFVLKDRKHANFRFESLSDTKSKRNFDSRNKKPAKICFAK